MLGSFSDGAIGSLGVNALRAPLALCSRVEREPGSIAFSSADMRCPTEPEPLASAPLCGVAGSGLLLPPPSSALPLPPPSCG